MSNDIIDDIPEPNTLWQHTNGNRYTVLMLTNEFTQRPVEYPITVVYCGENGNVWSRKLDDWNRSMTRVIS